MTEAQQAVLLLWQRVNTSLSAFYKLVKHFRSAELALVQGSDTWASMGIHAKHVARHREATVAEDNAFLDSINRRVQTGEFQLLFQDSPHYPPQLTELFYPPPMLFFKGDSARLSQAQIAIVGSRKPTPAAQKLTFDMAQYLAQSGYLITSGLAQGVDAQAHLGALAQSQQQGGRTIGVMGTGIDVCYPKQHQPLFDRIIGEGGCIISEILPGTLPNKHTFPRRNRIVAGLGLGTIVTEAALKSGSLITARLTSEQGKQVFAIPSSIDNLNAEGCHHLIREGATLITHPDHVIQDISQQLLAPATRTSLRVAPTVEAKSTTTKPILTKPVTPLNNITATTQNDSSLIPKPLPVNDTSIQATADISEHLQPLWVHIDWNGQDLDALVNKTKLTTPELLSQLMELELTGLITQVAGRYKRL